MRFQVLGSLEVRTDSGTPVPVGGINARRMLAALLLTADRVVSVERLTSSVWDSDPPASARRNIPTYVWCLRRALASAGAPNRLVTRPAGYLLHTEPGELDLGRFEALAAEGRALLGKDTTRARKCLRCALAMWHGDALADLTDGHPGLRAHAAQLDERRLAVWEECINADLAAGRHNDAVVELAGLTEAQPWRENLCRLHMVALYRSGRQADALAAFRQLRARLRNELGIDPSPRLAALHDRILRADPSLEHAARPASAPAARPHRSRRAVPHCCRPRGATSLAQGRPRAH